VHYDWNNHYHSDHCLLFEQLYEQSNRHVQIVDSVMEEFMTAQAIIVLQTLSVRYIQWQGLIKRSAFILLSNRFGFSDILEKRELV
jgi:hypothetical protein